MGLTIYLYQPQERKYSESIFISIDSEEPIEVDLEEWQRLFQRGLNKNDWTRWEKIEIVSDEQCIYQDDITHNLTKMAKAAQLYDYLWRSDEININIAEQLIKPLTHGLAIIKKEREQLEKLNPTNGFGSYDDLLKFVSNYLAACVTYPNAIVRIWR